MEDLWAAAEQTPAWSSASTSSLIAAVGGQGGGAGTPSQWFLYEPVSQCFDFGGGTQLTVLGESHLLPPSLLSLKFGQFSAMFFSFSVLSQLGHSFIWDPSTCELDLLPSLHRLPA